MVKDIESIGFNAFRQGTVEKFIQYVINSKYRKSVQLKDWLNDQVNNPTALILKYVDEVKIFNEDTPLKLIEAIRPDIIVKGGDYAPEQVVGSHIAEVKIFRTINGYSTTKIIQSLVDR